MKRLMMVALVLLSATPALAHRPSDSLLRVGVDGADLAGRWDIALRDLDVVVDLDADGDLAISGAELRAAAPRIAAYAQARLAIAADGQPCAVTIGEVRLAQRDGGADAALLLGGSCPRAPRQLTLDDRLLFDVDPTHRGLVRVTAGRETHTGVTAPAAHVLSFTLADRDAWREAAAFVREGIVHIWQGTDHVLFLLVLLLPAVLVRRDGAWQAAPRLGPIAADVLRIVSAFTVAHSLTLALSALDIVRLPTRFVEAAIAVTVLVAALHNLMPVSRARWPMAFYLGLLHGFGFSNVLGDLGVRGGGAAAALLGFNVGVEIGQATIVALFLPLAFALRRTWLYRRPVLAGGSLAVAAIAVVWTVERLA